MTARYIAIDWGSTNLRAWLYQGEECLESRQSEAGVTRLNGRSPAAVLAEITQHWRDGATPVVMAGMVGSNVGWKIAPYLPLPAAFAFPVTITITSCVGKKRSCWALAP